MKRHTRLDWGQIQYRLCYKSKRPAGDIGIGDTERVIHNQGVQLGAAILVCEYHSQIPFVIRQNIGFIEARVGIDFAQIHLNTNL